MSTSDQEYFYKSEKRKVDRKIVLKKKYVAIEKAEKKAFADLKRRNPPAESNLPEDQWDLKIKKSVWWYTYTIYTYILYTIHDLINFFLYFLCSIEKDWAKCKQNKYRSLFHAVGAWKILKILWDGIQVIDTQNEPLKIKTSCITCILIHFTTWEGHQHIHNWRPIFKRYVPEQKGEKGERREKRERDIFKRTMQLWSILNNL